MSSSQHPMPHSQRAASGAYAQSQYSYRPENSGRVISGGGGNRVLAPTGYDQQTLLQRETREQAMEKLHSMLCTFTTNLQKDNELTKETRAYRDAIAENLTSLVGVLNKIAFAHVQAAGAIRQILAHDIANPVHTARVETHLDDATKALTQAGTDLRKLEKEFETNRTKLGLASEQTPGVLRSIGNACHDYKIFSSLAVLSTVGAITSAALQIPSNLQNGEAVVGVLGFIGSVLNLQVFVSKTCNDSEGFAKLKKKKDSILTVADSINELLEVLAILHRTWTRITRSELNKKYKSEQTDTLDPVVLTSIADALDTHAGGLRELLHVMRPTVTMVKEGLDRKQIEAPRRLLMGSHDPNPARTAQAGRPNRLRRDPRFPEAIEALGNINNV